MSEAKPYGFNSSNKLRKFASSTACLQCGDQMIISKRDPDSYTCRKHQNERRLKGEVDNERKFFEYIKALMVNSGAKGIMVHEIVNENGKPARGKLKAFIPIETMSNPSMSWPIAMMIQSSLYSIGKESSQFLEILESDDGFYGITWRLKGDIALNIEKSADMISLAIEAVERLNKGALISGVYTETVKDVEALNYINACEISDAPDTSSELKLKLKPFITENKKRLPKI